MDDCIHIASLELLAHLGVTAQERAQAQRVTVSLTLHPAQGFGHLEDRLENTIDYAAVCAALRSLTAERPRALVETLADEMADRVLKTFGNCRAVDVELRKYILSDTAYVAVRLSRTL